MKEIIDEKKKNLENAKIEVETISKVYKEMIDESIAQINQYKGFIKNLENMNEAYQSIIDNNIVKVSQANRELADVVNKLISKKEF